MRILPKSGGGALCLLFVFALCSVAHSLSCDVKVVGDVEVIGYSEISKIKIPNAFSGLVYQYMLYNLINGDHVHIYMHVVLMLRSINVPSIGLYNLIDYAYIKTLFS